MQEMLGIIAAIMGIALHLPYLLQSIKKTITPHPFTWILWASLTLIVFFIQVFEGAGPGAWVTGAVGFMSFTIVIASIRNGFDNIKTIDVVLFITGLLTIPIWLLADNPTLSVILLVTIDLIAFAPTFRKSWNKPHEEPLYLYSWNVLRHTVSLFAITHLSIATALFPFCVMLANGSLAVFLLYRRKMLAQKA